jgi:hypothetical protein
LKKYFTLLFLVCLFIEVHSQNVQWARSINITYNDYINDLQVDKDGSVIITGHFDGTVDFDPGPDTVNLTSAGVIGSDIFLAKYDSNGIFLWAHPFGNNFFNDDGDRVATDTAGNIFLTGFFLGNVDFDPDSTGIFIVGGGLSARSRFLAKYDRNGHFLYAKNVGNAVGTLPSSQDGQTGLGCDRDGNVYMSGFYGTSLTLGPEGNGTLGCAGLSDNYFAKYDTALNFLWAHRIGSPGTEYSQGMYVNDTGTVIVLGSFNGTIDLDPDTGNFFLTQVGSTEDGYVAEYDSTGHFILGKHFIPGTSCAPIAVTVDSRKNIIVTGSASGTLDADPDSGVVQIGQGFNDQVFLASYDSLGHYRWAFAYGDVAAYQAGISVSLDTSDNIFLTGFYQPFVDLDPGTDTATLGSLYTGFIALYDSAGNFKTEFSGHDALNKLKIHNEALYMSGFFFGLTDMDPGSSTYMLQGDTVNASWYLMKMHLCDSLASTPGTIDFSSACSEDTILVSVHSGGPLYEWTFSSGLHPVGITDGDTVRIVIDSTASDEIITSKSLGGCLNSAVTYTHIFVHQPLIPDITETADTLHATSGAISYQWYRNDTLIGFATDSIYIPPGTGNYSVLITDSNGCQRLSAPFLFLWTGNENDESEIVEIFPNPFTNDIKLSFSEMIHDQVIIINDVNGHEVIRKSFSGMKGTINLENLSQGIYFLKWIGKKTIHHRRIIKL